MVKKYHFVSVIVILLIYVNFFPAIIYAKYDKARKIGDIVQISNPIIAFVISTQDSGAGHFILTYGASMAVMGLSKEIGKATKWKLSQRPDNKRYDGFPSGHAISAWSSASYIANFSTKYKYLAVPAYAGAVITAYSRVSNRRHSFLQVLAAGLISEIINYTIKNSKWSIEYKPINLIVNNFKTSIVLNIYL